MGQRGVQRRWWSCHVGRPRLSQWCISRCGRKHLHSGYLDNNRIRKMDASTGIITTVAGNGTQGYSGDGGSATSASLNGPAGVSVDAEGNIFIADTGNNRIRKVYASTGIITTVAGNGTQGYSGDGGSATSASLNEPAGVSVDAAGNIYIADTGNNSIRKVFALELNHPYAPAGVTAIAGDGQATVSFSAPLSDGGSPITSYTVIASSGTITATGSSSPITVTGLTNGTIYTFTVTATNAVGTSAPSLPSNSVTPGYFSVTPVVVGKGTLSPGTPITVAPNKKNILKVAADVGYHIESVTGCDGRLSRPLRVKPNIATYVTGRLTTGCIVTATFAVNQFTVKPMVFPHGSIGPNTTQTVDYNNTTSFTVIPDPGYHIKHVRGCNGTLVNNIYTTGGISRDCVVTATFEIDRH